MKTIKILVLFAIATVAWQCSKPQAEILNAISPNDRFPTLSITTDTGTMTLKLSELAVQVEIVGNTVTTTMDMRFYNDLDRVLEGQLDFPLENEQVVSRFAMEINDKLREGVVVEKEKGRRAFETIVRNQVDPGLLEMTKGNNFRARVYPIPAKGYKRIVIGYEEELNANDDGWYHHLAMDLKEKIAQFSLDIEVRNHKVAPLLQSKNIENLSFQQKSDNYHYNFKAKNYIPDNSWTVLIPNAKKSKPIVLTEKTSDGTYFYISTGITPVGEKEKLPQKITLLWDVSNSAKGKDVEAELNALDVYLKTIKNGSVTLVSFSNTIHSQETFTIKGGNWNALKTTIQKFQYDGGTQLGTIDLTQFDSDQIILSTDGLSTLGKSELTITKTPIIVFNSNVSADDAYLKFIAQSSGGKYLDLNHLKIEEVSEVLFNEIYQFISAEYDGQKIKETYPNVATPVQHQFALGGILVDDKSATITLNFGIGSKILKQIPVTIKPSNDEKNVRRLWAKRKIAQLSMQTKKYEEEITNLGVSHSLVTPYTSLIVLETVEDYVRYEIVPPSELQEEYYKLLANKTTETEETKKQQESDLLAAFEEQKSWWTKKHKAKPKKKRNNTTAESYEETEEEAVEEATEEETSANDGAITITANGNGALEYSIDGGTDWISSQPNNENIANAGTYSISVADAENELEETTATDSISIVDTEKESTVQLEKWAADTTYSKKLNAVSADKRYATYLALKEEATLTATFYLDIAEYFLNKKDKTTALRILSNIAEMDLENRELLKILADRLRQLGELDLAILIYKDILRIKGEEPQAHRDLALAYIDAGKYQKALDIFYKIITKNWEENEDRFKGIKIVVLTEMNNLIALHKADLDISKIPAKWIKNLPVDVRIILNWSSDGTDVDLWVTDPNGEKGFYSNKFTSIGGRFTFDMTRGYGPEEFMLKNAIKGDYLIQADFYGDTRQKVAGNVTIIAQFFTNYGRPNQKMQEIVLTLSGVKEVVNMGKVRFE